MNRETIKDIMSRNITINGKSVGDMEKEKLKVFLTHLKNVTIVYRCVRDSYLEKQYDATLDNIALLSSRIFLYGDKGKLFYENLDNKLFNLTIDDISERTIEFIYDKMQKVFVERRFESLATKERIESFVKKETCFVDFWKKTQKKEWVSLLNNFSDEQKQKIKDYYVALLHTVGLAGYGRNSYFLSTSSFPQIGHIMGIKDGIEIVGWVKINKSNVYTQSKMDKHADYIKSLSLPIVESRIFEEQKEITYKCGILPHYIIGYFYNNSSLLSTKNR